MGRHGLVAAVVLAAAVLACSGCAAAGSTQATPTLVSHSAATAVGALDELPVKGRAPKTGYARQRFGAAWIDTSNAPWSHNDLDTRNDVLSRDMTGITCKTPPPVRAAPHCVVKSGILHDPYTGKTLAFTRGNKTSTLVQIDHVVSLSDAWQTGAQQISAADRMSLANDPLNLIATDGQVNQAKSDGDAATWLVPNKSFRCLYVSRQVAVKAKYRLWVTPAEKAAIQRVLAGCPQQPLPSADDALRQTPSR